MICIIDWLLLSVVFIMQTDLLSLRASRYDLMGITSSLCVHLPYKIATDEVVFSNTCLLLRIAIVV